MQFLGVGQYGEVFCSQHQFSSIPSVGTILPASNGIFPHIALRVMQ